MKRKPVVQAQAERMARRGHGAEAIARRCGIDRRQARDLLRGIGPQALPPQGKRS